MKRIAIFFIFVAIAAVFASANISAAAQDIIVSRPAGTSCFSSISEAVKVARDGDIIVVRGGTYDSPSEPFPILVDKAISIVAAKDEIVIVDSSSIGTAFEIVHSDVVIDSLKIVHGKYGVLVKSEDAAITNCTISLPPESAKWGAAGIWLSGSKNALISGCSLENCGLAISGEKIDGKGQEVLLTGLFKVGSDKTFFTSQSIVDTQVNGKPLVYITETEGLELTGEAGQVVLAGCKDINVHGMTIANASIAFLVAHCSGIELKECNAKGNNIFGFYLAYSKSSTMQSCAAIGGNHGFDFRGTSGISLINGIIQGNEQGLFASFSDGLKVSVSDISRNSIGMNIYDTQGVGVIDTSFSDNSVGLQINRTSLTTISRCSFRNNWYNGMRIATGCEGTEIKDSDFIDNSTGLVMLSDGMAVVTGSKFTGNLLSGIFVDEIQPLILDNNIFMDNGSDIKQ